MEELDTFVIDKNASPMEDKNIDIEPKKTKKRPKQKSVEKNTDEFETEPCEKCSPYIGKVTYFNKETMVVGIRCNGIGYQTKACKFYSLGDNIVFSVKDGEVIAE